MPASVGRATVARLALALPGMTFTPDPSPAVIRMTVPLEVERPGGKLLAKALVADMTPPTRT